MTFSDIATSALQAIDRSRNLRQASMLLAHVARMSREDLHSSRRENADALWALQATEAQIVCTKVSERRLKQGCDGCPKIESCGLAIRLSA